jgi:hypothetical protein
MARKGKFIFVYADGSTMTDRNGYTTITQARRYMSGWNKMAQRKRNPKDRITRVIRKHPRG